jgi:IS5 family transposase
VRDWVHSLHDPTVRCIGKGNAGKPYAWNRRVGFTSLAQSGVIVGVASFEQNLYDGDTLAKTLASATTNTGKLFKSVLVDRGYKGQTRNGSTEVVQPGRKGPSGQSAYQKRRHRKWMNRRAAIGYERSECGRDPGIGHMKHDHRMVCCFLKGFAGSVLNAHLAAAACNFRKWVRESAFLCLLANLWTTLCLIFASPQNPSSPFLPPDLSCDLSCGPWRIFEDRRNSVQWKTILTRRIFPTHLGEDGGY